LTGICGLVQRLGDLIIPLTFRSFGEVGAILGRERSEIWAATP